MVSFVIAIVTAMVVGVVGLAVSAAIGQAILAGINDVCKDKGNEEDSRAAGASPHQDSGPFLN